jgi:hypothetical protein
MNSHVSHSLAHASWQEQLEAPLGPPTSLARRALNLGKYQTG